VVVVVGEGGGAATAMAVVVPRMTNQPTHFDDVHKCVTVIWYFPILFS
jgi:hypothetical protein